MDNDLLKGYVNWDTYSTGNKLKDTGIGALFGLADALNNKGDYYVRANYKGNGLADTGIGYMSNPDYKNVLSLYEPMMARLNQGKWGQSLDNQQSQKSGLTPILGRLSTMKGNLGNWSANLLGRLNKNAYGIRGNFPIDIA